MTTRTGCDNCMHKSVNGLSSSSHTIYNPHGYGCIYIDTSKSPSIRVWVIGNTSLHVLRSHPYKLTQVLYDYDLHSYELYLHWPCF